MSTDRPPVSVSSLTRRLADTPEEITGEATSLPAVAGDVLLRLDPDALAPRFDDLSWLPALAEYQGNRRALALLACWVAADEHLLAASLAPAGGLRRLLTETVPVLGDAVRAKSVPGNPDRREELARLVLRDLGVRPDGETVEEATDRLTTVDSLHRARVLRAAKQAEERAAAVRKAMAEKKAQEAAARYSQV